MRCNVTSSYSKPEDFWGSYFGQEWVRVEFLIPPDKQEKATQTVLEQDKLLALDWAA